MRCSIGANLAHDSKARSDLGRSSCESRSYAIVRDWSAAQRLLEISGDSPISTLILYNERPACAKWLP